MIALVDFVANAWQTLVVLVHGVLDFAIGLFDWVPGPAELMTWSVSSGVWVLLPCAAWGAPTYWFFHIRPMR